MYFVRSVWLSLVSFPSVFLSFVICLCRFPFVRYVVLDVLISLCLSVFLYLCINSVLSFWVSFLLSLVIE